MYIVFSKYSLIQDKIQQVMKLVKNFREELLAIGYFSYSSGQRNGDVSFRSVALK
jgi:hypothetical protein